MSAATERVLAGLRTRDEPTTVAVLAATTSLHPNTVREHLDSLVRSGLAARTRTQPVGRGRPAWAYEATSSLAETSKYAELSVVLSSVIAHTSAHPSADAALAGEDWGRDLARRRGAAPTTPDSARDHAVELLGDLGFGPRQDPRAPTEVRLTQCPLLDAARRAPSIVCSVHLGMLRGVLSAYGADPSGSALVPFAEAGACVLVLPPTGGR